MSAKEYLSQARSLKIRIETMREQLAFLRSASLCVKTTHGDSGVPVTRNIHKTEDAVIRLLEKENEIKTAQERLTEIMSVIDGVSDSDGHAVLVKRYLCNKTWNTISTELYISRSRVFTLHNDALAEIEKAIKNTD